jgi:hypothetical protein
MRLDFDVKKIKLSVDTNFYYQNSSFWYQCVLLDEKSFNQVLLNIQIARENKSNFKKFLSFWLVFFFLNYFFRLFEGITVF